MLSGTDGRTRGKRWASKQNAVAFVTDDARFLLSAVQGSTARPLLCSCTCVVCIRALAFSAFTAPCCTASDALTAHCFLHCCAARSSPPTLHALHCYLLLPSNPTRSSSHLLKLACVSCGCARWNDPFPSVRQPPDEWPSSPKRAPTNGSVGRVFFDLPASSILGQSMS